MSNQTTGPEASGDAGSNSAPDYKAKYDGLQSAFQKRQNEWLQKEAEWAVKQAEHEAQAERWAEYEAKEAAAAEEKAQQEQYEALKAKFEPEPPTPGQHSEFSTRTSGNREPEPDITKGLHGEKPDFLTFEPDITAR